MKTESLRWKISVLHKDHITKLTDATVRYKTKDGELRHRAAGLWQAHANHQNAAVWGSTDLRTQALDAARMLRQATARCSTSGTPSATPSRA
jgi:hypothetical protein